jgi:hypothetical protein
MTSVVLRVSEGLAFERKKKETFLSPSHEAAIIKQKKCMYEREVKGKRVQEGVRERDRSGVRENERTIIDCRSQQMPIQSYFDYKIKSSNESSFNFHHLLFIFL